MGKIWLIRFNDEGFGSPDFIEQFISNYGSFGATISLEWYPDYENTGTASLTSTVEFAWQQSREKQGDISYFDFYLNDNPPVDFTKYLIKDYGEVFEWRLKPDGSVYIVNQNGSPWVGLTYSFDYGTGSMDPDFFVTEILTEEGEQENLQNELVLEIDTPVDGSYFEFYYKPDYPDDNTQQVVRFNFVTSVTQSNTATDLYIEVKGTQEEQMAEIEKVFNTVKNPAEQFQATINDNIFTIKPSDFKPIGRFSSSDGQVSELVDMPLQQPIPFQKVRVRSPHIIKNLSQGSVSRYRVTMNFNSQPTAGDRFVYTIRKNGVGVYSFDKIFSSGANSFSLIAIGGSLSATVNNIVENFRQYHQHQDISFTVEDTVGLKIHIDLIGEPDDVYTLQIYLNDNLNDGNTILGPVNIGVPLGEFDATEFQITSWSGNISDTQNNPDYTVTKQLNSDDQTSLYIDWTKLTRNDLTADVGRYTNMSTVNNTVAKWVKIKRRNKLYNNYISNNDTYYYITDGYLDLFESQSQPKILWSGFKLNNGVYTIKRRFSRTSNVKIPFNTEGFFGYLQTPQGTVGNLNGDITESSQVYRYLNVIPPEDSDSYIYEFHYYTGPVWKVEIEWYDECKYDSIDLYFKNKWGMLETISTTKLSRRVLSTDNETYTKSVMDMNGNVNRNLHTKKDFNKTGREEWTLNTEFLSEDVNQIIEQMYLSEEVYMAYRNTNTFMPQPSELSNVGYVLPVTMKDRNFGYKTRLNDRKVQYTFKVEASHEKVNNLQ